MAVLAIGAICAAANASPNVGAVKMGTIVRDCPDCPEMVAIPQLGHSAADPGTVFYAGRYEITWKEYIAAIEAGACPPMQISESRPKPWPSPETYDAIKDNYPLTLVSPNEFQCYIAWINAKTGKNYHIPSMNDWEHLARGGATTKYPWGDDIGYGNSTIRALLPDGSRYYDLKQLSERYQTGRLAGIRMMDVRKSLQSDDVWPVGSFEPNGFGLYDVIGNVEEVTTERSNGCASRKDLTKPCTWIATRGVSYIPKAEDRKGDFSLLTYRGVTTLNNKAGNVGFRLVRN